MQTGVISGIGLIAAAIIYIGLNTLVSVMAPVNRLDVTQERLFTLSDGSRRTLENIDEPLHAYFFFSEALGREVPFYGAYSRQVKSLLTVIASASDGRLILHEYNPEPFSELADRAVAYGIQGVPLDQGGELAYFGLAVANTVDEIETIAFFQPEREALLEYDIMRIVDVLSNPEPVVIGVLGSLPVMGDMQAQMQGGVMVPWAIATELRSQFELINLPEAFDELPDKINLLMVVHPQAMTPRSIYQLEQFLFRGGRAIIFVDPKAESDLNISPDRASTSVAGLKPLLQQWGISVEADKLVADRSMALRINAGTAAQPVPAEYVLWLAANEEHLAADDPVTSQLAVVNLATAGSIQQSGNSPLSLQPLIFTGENSSRIHVDKAGGLRPDIIGLLNSFEADDKKYVIAARLSGEVTTAFPDGPPARAVESNTSNNKVMRTEGPVNLVLVADTDLLDERFWLRKQQFFGREVAEKIAGNADFVLNAIEQLSGSAALVDIRSRGVSQRAFEKVIELERQAEIRLQDSERELQAKLKQAQDKIAALQGVETVKDPTSGELTVNVSLTDQQRQQVEAIRREMLEIRQQLRTVQRKLREDVERLETRLEFFNIGLMPILVLLIAVLLAVVRYVTRPVHRDKVPRGMAG